MIENQIQNLIKGFTSGKVKTADFENNLYQIINVHTNQQIQNAVGNEYYVFIRETFRELFIKYMTEEIELSTVKPEDLDADGVLMLLNQKVVEMEDQLTWFQRFISRTDFPTYKINRERYALRMAYLGANSAFNYFRTEKMKEEAERQKAMKKYQEEMAAQQPKDEPKEEKDLKIIPKKKNEK